LLADGSTIVGPFEYVAIAHGGNYAIVVPTSHENDPDPPVFKVDQHESEQPPTQTNSLSGFLSTLDRGRNSKELDALLGKIPTEAQACFRRGLRNESDLHWKGAIVEYDRALATRPAYVDALIRRGWAKHRLDDWRGALADYDLVLGRSPYDAHTYYQRGLIRAAHGEPKAALADFAQAAAISPDYASFETDPYIQGLLSRPSKRR
jgi:tetratricopeptide (TPR) repeat protein